MVKEQELEAGPKEEQTQLNMREKDEGDLFGIRAIEAGFYAGVHQSRPTSRAGSVINHPSMSSSTSVADTNTAFFKGHSTNKSVLSLHLSQHNGAQPERRISPLTMKLCPTEAELTGKHGAVDMALRSAPSPVHWQGQTPPTIRASDGGNSDGLGYARTTSPLEHYTKAPAIPVCNALQTTNGIDTPQSERAFFSDLADKSPTITSHPQPVIPSLPTLPATVYRQTSRSPSPEYKSTRM
jgi:hypothetical protein